MILIIYCQPAGQRSSCESAAGRPLEFNRLDAHFLCLAVGSFSRWRLQRGHRQRNRQTPVPRFLIAKREEALEITTGRLSVYTGTRVT